MVKIQAFFGLYILFEIHQLPETSLSWSKGPALSTLEKRVTTRDRFVFHLNNNDNAIPYGQPSHDKLFKVFPFLQAVVNTRRRVSPKTQFFCWWMVGFKGQLSMNQYVPLKEVKPGLKFGNMQNLQTVTPVISKGTQAKKIVVWPNTDLVTMLFGSPNSCFSKNITMFSVITIYIHPPCLWSPERPNLALWHKYIKSSWLPS